MSNVRDLLETRHATDRVIVPPAVSEFLAALDVVEPNPVPATPNLVGKVKPKPDLKLLGFASFVFDPGAPHVEFELTVLGPPATPTGFRVDLTLNDRLKLPAFLQPAVVENIDGKATLKPAPTPGPVRVTGLIALRIEGTETAEASVRVVVPGTSNAVVTVNLNPSVVLFGGSGFGLDFTGGLVIDDSATEAPAPAPGVEPGPAATPAWRGIAVRNAKFYFPASTPLLGGRPLEVGFQLGNPVGLHGFCKAEVPEDGSRPRVVAEFEWHDPLADSLATALPTLISVTTEFPVQGRSTSLANAPVTGPIQFSGAEKLIVRGRFARDVRQSPPAMTFSLGVDRTGPDGLIAVEAGPGISASKVFVTAGALAVAFMADADRPDPAPSGDATGTTLHALLVAAAGLSAALAKSGKLVIHGVEVSGTTGPADKTLRFRVDYSVDVVIQTINVGVLSVGMNDAVPMRVRYRNVALEVNFAKSGLDRFHLSYSGADFGVEDPGKWLVNSPGSLLDVLGTRSGRGSTWFEIDLRFAVELGPVKVSGATVRATFDRNNPTAVPAVSLRGLDARIDMPGVLTGHGMARLQPGGFDAALASTLIPLQLGALGMVGYEDAGAFRKVLLAFAVDLPGPIPLANSGLGIYGFQGVFGINCKPQDVSAAPDPPTALLAWKPWNPGAMPAHRGGTVFGLGASIGTVPDLGFAFSAKALVVVAVPDLAVRAAVEGRVMSEPVKLAQLEDPPPLGPRLLGAFSADSGGVTVGIRGEFEVERLLKIVVPFGAFFPSSGNNWYIHLGSDNRGNPVRGPGPIEVKVLPGLLDIGASAFLMIRGDGIDDFAGTGKHLNGFAIGFGFAWKTALGFSIIRLELSASASVGLGTNPMMFVGQGKLGGSLHLGPVSLGVSAQVDLQVGPSEGDLWAKLHVCGEVDLFFFSISGCVDLSIGKLSAVVPDPSAWPLTRAALTDRFYNDAAPAAESPDAAPTVWPDVIPILQFSNGPACGLTAGPFLAKLTTPVTGGRAWSGKTAGDGSFGSNDLKYTFSLTQLDLFEVSGANVETPVPGDLWAAWQLPKHTAGERPGARELALLTWQPHLWTKVLPDGGKKLPSDPLEPLGNHCHTEFRASSWWAIGSAATPADGGWDVPPEPPGLRRFHGLFTARADSSFAGQPLTPEGLYAITLAVAFDLGGVVAYPGAVPASGHSFTGSLKLPQAIDRPENFDQDPLANQLGEGVLTQLQFSVPVISPTILLALSGDHGERSVRILGRFTDGSVHSFAAAETAPGPDGRRLVAFRSADSGMFATVDVRYDARRAVELVGVQGSTKEAFVVADAAQKGANAGSQNVAVVAGGPLGNGESLLKSGTLYKLVVGQKASGVRPGGTPKEFAGPTRTFWFRTAPVPSPPPPPAAGALLVPVPAVEKIFSVRRRFKTEIREDLFDPAYLERYLLGYTPEDHARYWFCDDPVAVHFKVEYIGAFTALYGRELQLRCVRTDTPPAQPQNPFIMALADIHSLSAIHLATAADRRLIVRDLPPPGDCPLPPVGGATVAGKPPLEPGGTYDLAAAFPLPGQPESGNQLPGVVFTTSRWRNPQELFAALGFAAAPGTAAGDVPAPAGASAGFGAGETVGDAALEQALSRFGLTRWPPPVAPRTTTIWVPSGAGWRLAAVLLEAPEPIHRPAPVKDAVARLRVLRLTHGGTAFETLVRDSSATRLLFATANPFAPAAPLEVVVAEQLYPVGGKPGAPVEFSIRCTVPAVPRFAEDLE